MAKAPGARSGSSPGTDEATDGAPGGAPAPIDVALLGRSSARPSDLALLVGSFVAALAGVGVAALVRTGGQLTYAIDDPYIHLSLARTLAQHGTFGLEAGVYESASSSPGWELLLVPVLAVTDRAAWWPLVINLAAAGWILWVLARLPAVARVRRQAPAGALAVVLLPITLGLVPLVAVGMEHTLHAAVWAQVLVVLRRRLGTDRRRDLAVLVLLLGAASLLRFESLFLGAGCALALLVVGWEGRRRWVDALAVAGATAVPVACFAAVNVSFGQYLLPNSVVAKAGGDGGLPVPDPGEVLSRVGADLLLVGIALALVLAAVRARRVGAGPALGVAIAAAVPIALQVLFADVGWFARYQGYLVVGGAVALLLALPDLGLTPSAWRAIALILVLAAAPRAALLINTPTAIENIHDNQLQLGSFLAEEYDGEPVAVNDIGWVSWRHGGPLLDVAGLGSHDVLRRQRDEGLDAEWFAAEADRRGIEVLAVYGEIFGALAPPDWAEGGRWCVEGRRYVLSSECVDFYAPEGEPLQRLIAALDAWAPRLPDGVRYEPAGAGG